MGISRRHHYIPQFLIKKFADSDNMLYLYDKEKKTFAKEKRSPKSIFFEMNRNILDFGGTANDNLEKLYAELDEKFSRDLTEIIATKNITEEGLTSLLVMVSSLKWRLPVNDELFYDKDRQYTYDKLPISIKAINDDGSQNTEASRTVWNGSQLGKNLSANVFNKWWDEQAIENRKQTTNDNTTHSSRSSQNNTKEESETPHELFDFLNKEQPAYNEPDLIEGLGSLLPDVQDEDYEEQEFANRMKKKRKRKRGK